MSEKDEQKEMKDVRIPDLFSPSSAV